jgi:hypothetical protein
MNKVIKNSFTYVNKNSIPWYIKADELMYAGKILRNISIEANSKINTVNQGVFKSNTITEKILNDHSIFGQATMLIGFALENYLKGLWIEQNDIKINDSIDRLPKQMKTHDLASLANELNIELEKDEIEVLNFFTESVKWFGRYPIPLYVSQYINNFNTRPAYIIENGKKDSLPIELESIIKKIKEKINPNNYPLSSTIINS